MKALVVGASGNIGSRLVVALHSRGHDVRALIRPGSLRPVAGGAEIFPADVMEPAGLKGAADGVDVVYHLVGYLFAPRRSLVEPLNMAAARNVAEMAIDAGVKRLVFTSSALVYGPGARMPSAEDDFRRPDTAYSRAKAAVEDYLLGLAPRGLQATILRVGHVYGLNVSAIEEFKNLIGRGFYRTAGPGDHLIPPINVDDLALALCLAGENTKAAGRTYNVNDDEPLPLREFSDLLAERMGKGPVKSAPVWLFKSAATFLESLSKVTGRQPFFDRDTVTLMMEAHGGDNARLKRELGWAPKYKSFREGVATCFE